MQSSSVSNKRAPPSASPDGPVAGPSSSRNATDSSSPVKRPRVADERGSSTEVGSTNKAPPPPPPTSDTKSHWSIPFPTTISSPADLPNFTSEQLAVLRSKLPNDFFDRCKYGKLNSKQYDRDPVGTRLARETIKTELDDLVRPYWYIAGTGTRYAGEVTFWTECFELVHGPIKRKQMAGCFADVLGSWTKANNAGKAEWIKNNISRHELIKRLEDDSSYVFTREGTTVAASRTLANLLASPVTATAAQAIVDDIARLIVSTGRDPRDFVDTDWVTGRVDAIYLALLPSLELAGWAPSASVEWPARQVVSKVRADKTYLGQDLVDAAIERAIDAVVNGNPIPALDPLTDPHRNVAECELNPDHHPLDALRNKVKRDEPEVSEVKEFVKFMRTLGIAFKQEARSGLHPILPEVAPESAGYLGKDWSGLNDVKRAMPKTEQYLAICKELVSATLPSIQKLLDLVPDRGDRLLAAAMRFQSTDPPTKAKLHQYQPQVGSGAWHAYKELERLFESKFASCRLPAGEGDSRNERAAQMADVFKKIKDETKDYEARRASEPTVPERKQAIQARTIDLQACLETTTGALVADVDRLIASIDTPAKLESIMTAFETSYYTPDCQQKGYHPPWNADHISVEIAREQTRLVRLPDLKGRPVELAAQLDVPFIAVTLACLLKDPALASLFVTFYARQLMRQNQENGLVSLEHLEIWARLPATEAALVLCSTFMSTDGWLVRDPIVRDAWAIIGDQWNGHPRNLAHVLEMQDGLCGALSCQKTLLYSVMQKGQKRKDSPLYPEFVSVRQLLVRGSTGVPDRLLECDEFECLIDVIYANYIPRVMTMVSLYCELIHAYQRKDMGKDMTASLEQLQALVEDHKGGDVDDYDPDASEQGPSTAVAEDKPRGRGRPSGSKNKAKAQDGGRAEGKGKAKKVMEPVGSEPVKLEVDEEEIDQLDADQYS